MVNMRNKKCNGQASNNWTNIVDNANNNPQMEQLIAT
jgi:hypothetical protein